MCAAIFPCLVKPFELEAQRKNAEPARELNAQRDAAANQKSDSCANCAVGAKESPNQGRRRHRYYYTHGTKIDKIYVSAAVQTQLTAGRLVIVCLEGNAELLPRIIADKIAERDASLVVRVKKATTEIDADDPYAAFQILDDFTW